MAITTQNLAPVYGTRGKYQRPIDTENYFLMNALGAAPQEDPAMVNMTQLGYSPEAYQQLHQGTGGSGQMLDPSGATWNDSWGWLTPTSNIRQVETGDATSLNSILGLTALAAGGAYMGGAFAPGGQFASAAAPAAPTVATPTAAGSGAVDYSLLGGSAAPSLSTYGTGALAGTATPSLSTYGMGGLPGAMASTGGTALGSLAGNGATAMGSLAGGGLPAGLGASPGGTALPGIAKPVINSLTGSGSAGGYLSNLISAGNAYNQGQNTGETYDRAFDLITTPSADQQRYRTQLSTLMENPGSMESSPVYQAMLDQGMNAVNRTSAAKGMLNSGGRLTDLMKVGQDAASKYYFPQADLLSGLSGVRGDSAVRALGADALIGGQSADNRLQNQMWSDLLGGYQSGSNQGGGGFLGDIVNWFGNQSNTANSGENPMDYLL